MEVELEHPDNPTGPGTLAGHSLIRLIGSGSRSEVFLARAPAASPQRPPVAVKVFRRDTDPGSIGREVHALLNTPQAALARLDDVATTPDGRLCLVLDHLPGPPLDRLLMVSGRVGAAEIVTVAATVTATLQALHESGLSHPLVRTSLVRFDARGRPVLLGLGALAELPAGVAGVAVRRDAAVALTGFIRGLLAYLDPTDPAAPAAQDLLDGFESSVVARPFPATLAGLEAALFAWAPAGPVRTDGRGSAAPPEPAGAPTPVPAGLVLSAAAPTRPRGALHTRALRTRAALIGAEPSRTVTSTVTSTVPSTVPRTVPSGAVALGPLDTAARLVRIPGQLLTSLRHGVRSAPALRIRAGRRPVLLGFGLTVALVAGGLAALSMPPGTPGKAGTAAAGSPAVAGDVNRTSSPGPGASGQPQGGSVAGDPAAVAGDDPAAAVLELLRLRAACLTEKSVLCLDGVDQSGSVAMAADGYRIRQLQAGGAPPAAGPGTAATARVQERTGNAALVVLSDGAGAGVNPQPASALVIKGEAGWRLRELFDY